MVTKAEQWIDAGGMAFTKAVQKARRNQEVRYGWRYLSLQRTAFFVQEAYELKRFPFNHRSAL
ncbi:hypothetical protein O9993_09830 [Vibrio lentus]|nr:hypothetical protein [Vibrio lentus]